MKTGVAPSRSSLKNYIMIILLMIHQGYYGLIEEKTEPLKRNALLMLLAGVIGKN